MKSSYINKCSELLSNKKNVVIWGCIFLILQAIVSIISTIFSAYYAIDVALVSGDVDKFIMSAIVVLILGVLETILFHLMYRRGINVCKHLGVEIREKIFNS